MTHKHPHLFHFLPPLKLFPLLSRSPSLSHFSSQDIVGHKNAEWFRHRLDTRWDFAGLCLWLPAQGPTLSVRRRGIRRQSRSLLVSVCHSRAESVPLASLMGVFTLDTCTVSHLYFFQMLNQPGKYPGTLAAFSAADIELFIWKFFRAVSWHLSLCLQHCLESA